MCENWRQAGGSAGRLEGSSWPRSRDGFRVNGDENISREAGGESLIVVNTIMGNSLGPATFRSVTMVTYSYKGKVIERRESYYEKTRGNRDDTG